MPLSADPNLDADDDEEEHQYRKLDNILGMDAVLGWGTVMLWSPSCKPSAWKSPNR